MFVTPRDSVHDHRSTLGYSIIDLDAMAGTNAGTLLHLSAAQVARELGVELVVVETVLVNSPMDHLCQKMGMTPVGRDAYEADPADLEARCRERAAGRQWTLSEACQSR